MRLTTLVSCVGGSHDLGRHLVDYAGDQKADMIIMGSRGLGSFKRTMLSLFGLGSVSDFVIRNAPMDVLVHKMAPQKLAVKSD